MDRILGCFSTNNESKENVLKMAKTINFKNKYMDTLYGDDTVILNGFLFSSSDISKNRFIVSEDNDIIIGIDGFIYNIDIFFLIILYKKYDEEMFSQLNGQFSLAIIDKNKSKLILVRDRFGTKPMFYAKINDSIYFSSEINSLKAVLQDDEIDERSLRDICTTWANLGDHTFYKNISSVECGSYVSFSDGNLKSTKYFNLNILPKDKEKTEEDLVDELDYLLNKSIARRLNEPEKTAFYLSGGLDSSLIAAIASKHIDERIDTFSISFLDKNYDEAKYQDMISKYLNSNHRCLTVSSTDVISNIENVVKIIQSPITKTGLSPMYLLSRYVKENGFDTVLSGEGADEIFGGYDIFKEVKIREFCEKDPSSKTRPLLYKRLYSYVNGYESFNSATLSTFFNQVELNEMFSSHYTRFKYGDYCSQFFNKDLRDRLKSYDYIEEIKKNLPEYYDKFSKIAKAQYLEIETFLNNYLLLLQGDSIAMSNGISCKYPFLDNDITDFAFALKDKFKINVLNEKYLLKKLAARYLPDEFLKRKKFPFRAPIDCIGILDRFTSLLTENNLDKANIFNSKAVLKFIDNIKIKDIFSEREQMLLMFIVSVQCLKIKN